MNKFKDPRRTNCCIHCRDQQYSANWSWRLFFAGFPPHETPSPISPSSCTVLTTSSYRLLRLCCGDRPTTITDKCIRFGRFSAESGEWGERRIDYPASPQRIKTRTPAACPKTRLHIRPAVQSLPSSLVGICSWSLTGIQSRKCE